MKRRTLNVLSSAHKNASLIWIVSIVGCVSAGQAQITSANGLTSFKVSPASQTQVDFVNAKAIPLPLNYALVDQRPFLIQALTTTPSLGPAGHVVGSQGTGIASPTFLGAPASASNDTISPQQFGTNNHPFDTSRADLNSIATNTTYPYRAAGKLFFKIGTSSYICSASLIKKGIVVTAAHCVANFGKNQFYGSWQFVPGYRSGSAPYGTWTVSQVWVKTAYLNGTDACYQSGVICTDDVAVLILNPSGGTYAGASTGWFGYGYGGFGFAGSQAAITQLGYPAGLDSASLMERNDSSGFTNTTYSSNTIIGSNMDGGSSGGPWLVNFGTPPTLTGETNGTYPDSNIVVGVTSWGYNSTTQKEQGASAFTSNNILSLVNSACGATPAACN